MENFIVAIAEKTILGAGFFYLLYYLIKNMEAITKNLGVFGTVLQEVSETLIVINMRIGQLENKVKDLEIKRKDDE